MLTSAHSWLNPITDEIALAGAFIRHTDTLQNDLTDATSKDELDIFYAAMPVTLDGISATPYFAYAIIGEDTNALGNNANLMAPNSVAMTKTLMLGGSVLPLTWTCSIPSYSQLTQFTVP